MNLAYLRDQLVSSFNISELHNLCIDLDISFEDLPGQTLEDKARELVTYCHRHGQLNNLNRRCQVLRPHLDWVKNDDTNRSGLKIWLPLGFSILLFLFIGLQLLRVVSQQSVEGDSSENSIENGSTIQSLENLNEEKDQILEASGITNSQILQAGGDITILVQPSSSPIISSQPNENLPSNISPTVSSILPTLTVKPPVNGYYYELLSLHSRFFYEALGCINGDFWSLPTDSSEADQIAIGLGFNPEDLNDLVTIGPIKSYIVFEADVPIGEQLIVTNIEVTLEHYASPSEDVYLIGHSTICADPLIPEVSEAYSVLLNPGMTSFSMSQPKESNPEPHFYSVTSDSPLTIGVDFYALRPGWYSASLKITYTYKGQEASVDIDHPIRLYIPSDPYVANVFNADSFNDDTLTVLGTEEEIFLLDELRLVREAAIRIIRLDDPRSNPDAEGEYILIQNFGIERNLKNWKLVNLMTREEYYTFPSFNLGEGKFVRIWSGQGVDGPTDLYIGKDELIWSIEAPSGLNGIQLFNDKAALIDIYSLKHD